MEKFYPDVIYITLSLSHSLVRPCAAVGAVLCLLGIIFDQVCWRAFSAFYRCRLMGEQNTPVPKNAVRV